MNRLGVWKHLPPIAVTGCAMASTSIPAVGQMHSNTTVSRSSHDADVFSIARAPDESAAPRPFLFQRDYLLGTSFDLIVWATQAGEAHRVESSVLAEITRLSGIFSVYDPASEISRLNAGASLESASPDLMALLRAYAKWETRTGGALSSRMGGLIKIWDLAQRRNVLPTSTDLAACIAKLKTPGWHIDPATGKVRRIVAQAFNLNCLGKGYVIQKAMAAARTCSRDVSGLLLNIGGDIAVWGDGDGKPGTPWRISCADPLRPQDNAAPLTCIRISDRAVATSAAYERGYSILGRRFSHILDPRTGWPAEGVKSATVVARDNVTANALATALCIVSPGEGLDLLRAVDDVEGMIMAANGTLFRTPGFHAFESPVAQVSPAPDGTAVPTTNAAPVTSSNAAAGISTNAASPSASVPMPAPSDAGATTNSVSVTTPPVTATPPITVVNGNQIACLISGDTVSFVRGQSKMKRPVPTDEVFRVTAISGDDITISDQFGFLTTLNRAALKITDVTPAPAPAAPAAPAAIATTTAPVPVPPTDTAAALTTNDASPSPVSPTAPWPANYQVTLNVNLPPPPPNTKYVKRPYLAFWVEDASGKPVRSVEVWGQKPRWVPSLSNWWAIAGKQPDLVSRTTRATRDPGQYPLAWDGMDDAGKPVPQGTYTIVLEVAREFGGHDMHKGTIVCGTSSAQGMVAGAREFLDSSISYGPPGT